MAARFPLNCLLSEMTGHHLRPTSESEEWPSTEREQANFSEDGASFSGLSGLRERKVQVALTCKSKSTGSESAEKVNCVGELCLTPATRSAPSSTFLYGWSMMGRVAATSVARIYADVNAKLGPSWHEYGELGAICSFQHVQPLIPSRQPASAMGVSRPL